MQTIICKVDRLPAGSVVKNLPANAGDLGLIPASGRSPGEENDNPLRCSCLGNPMDGGAWWATVHGDGVQITRMLGMQVTELAERQARINSWIVTNSCN